MQIQLSAIELYSPSHITTMITPWAGGFRAARSRFCDPQRASHIHSESLTLYDIDFPRRVLENTMIDQSDALHTVVVYFRLAGNDLSPLHAIEKALAAAVQDAGAGSYDGYEVALLDGDEAYLFLVGPDAGRLYEAARPVLERSPLLSGAEITLRYGGPDDLEAEERRVSLAAA